MHARGQSDAQIAEMTGARRDTVARARRRLGLAPVRDGAPPTASAESVASSDRRRGPVAVRPISDASIASLVEEYLAGRIDAPPVPDAQAPLFYRMARDAAAARHSCARVEREKRATGEYMHQTEVRRHIMAIMSIAFNFFEPLVGQPALEEFQRIAKDYLIQEST